MKVPFYGVKSDKNNQIYLSELESRHCVKVLRHNVGDRIQVLDGEGSLYNCTILDDNIKHCVLDINSIDFKEKDMCGVHIVIAPPKNPIRIDWLIEKCVEMGVDRISFVLSERSIRTRIKYDRLERIAIASMKQSCSRYKLRIDDIVPYRSLIKEIKVTQRLIPHLEQGKKTLIYSAIKPNLDTCFLIGPEGDFTLDEIDLALSAKFSPVSLGNKRLRTETAALMVASTFNHVNGL